MAYGFEVVIGEMVARQVGYTRDGQLPDIENHGIMCQDRTVSLFT
jgi:hypothetical protein